MILDLKRMIYTPTTTLGVLRVNGAHQCFVCEDFVRRAGEPKVPGRTAIPPGVYHVVITYSPRFKRDLPLLVDVPGFTGVRIHPGNSADDTEGCLLPGAQLRYDAAGVPDGVLQSRIAFDRLFARILEVCASEPIIIHIENH